MIALRLLPITPLLVIAASITLLPLVLWSLFPGVVLPLIYRLTVALYCKHSAVNFYDSPHPLD